MDNTPITNTPKICKLRQEINSTEEEMWAGDIPLKEIIREEIGKRMAHQLFEWLKDGKHYAIQAKWIEEEGYNSYQYRGAMPLSVGYDVTISEVYHTPYFVREMPNSFSDLDFQPTWKQIKNSVGRRLLADIKPGKVARWLRKQILSRCLYYPEYNPSHWEISPCGTYPESLA